MVIGHSGCPEYICRYIYMFHMPCFYFISGYLLKSKYISNIKEGVIRKIQGTYWPFVKWSLIFLLFHNIFNFLHIYDKEYNLYEFGIKTIRILTLTGSESLLGGFWFLISLFWSSIITLIGFHLLEKWHRLQPSMILIQVVFLLIIAVSLNFISIKIPQQLHEQTLIATAFFMMGYIFKTLKLLNKSSLKIASLCLTIPAFFAISLNWSMSLKGFYIIPYFFVALLGTIGVLGLSVRLSHCKGADILVYIGNKTLYILIYHFLAFKLVSLLYIRYNNLPIEYLSQFPTLNGSPSYLWVGYSIIGIIIPLIIWKVFSKIQNIKMILK